MKRLLIVVDYQKDFVDGALGFDGAADLDERIAAKIDAYHEAGDTVAFTMDTHHGDYLSTQEGINLPVTHCVAGTPGWELYGKTAQARKSIDLEFVKPTFGSFELAEYLRTAQTASHARGNEPFASIELVGLVSNICVISNAVIAKAACPQVPISVDASCTASADPSINEQCLNVMEGLQIQVTNRA